jgi:enoyl-CoA hydratase/carnithine racemase
MRIKVSNNGINIRLLTMDRPPVNAMDNEMVGELSEAIQTAMSDQNVRVLVITGAGRFFVAGADVEELASSSQQEGEETVSRVKALQSLLRNGAKPVIAAINGMAAGGGLELAMACDFRIAARGVKLGLPEATLGVIPGAGGTQMLPRLAGIGKALEMMFTGNLIDAEEALARGLVERIAGAEGALEAALKIAEKISRNAPLALAEIKKAAYDTINFPLAEGLSRETQRFARLCDTEDKNEGISAFKARRPAQFKGC